MRVFYAKVESLTSQSREAIDSFVPGVLCGCEVQSVSGTLGRRCHRYRPAPLKMRVRCWLLDASSTLLLFVVEPRGFHVSAAHWQRGVLPMTTVLCGIFAGDWTDVKGFEVLFADILIVKQWAVGQLAFCQIAVQCIGCALVIYCRPFGGRVPATMLCSLWDCCVADLVPAGDAQMEGV